MVPLGDTLRFWRGVAATGNPFPAQCGANFLRFSVANFCHQELKYITSTARVVGVKNLNTTMHTTAAGSQTPSSDVRWEMRDTCFHDGPSLFHTHTVPATSRSPS